MAIICNVVLIGFVCWALVDQYPHPHENGFTAYAVLIVLTPILSVVAHLSKNRKGASHHSNKKLCKFTCHEP